MKLNIWVSVGRCKREEIIDTKKDWLYEDGEWESLSEAEREEEVLSWMANDFDFGYEEAQDE